MPRRARHISYGTIQHVISRFIDREWRFIDQNDRVAYLEYISQLAPRTDWSFLAFSLMSSHEHWALISGSFPFGKIFRSMHTSFGTRWQKKNKQLGHVFANRPRNFEVAPQSLLKLIAYLHMNPVRAGVVKCPKDSPWTSHRQYLRIDPPMPWLDVEYALSLLGFEDTQSGRSQFNTAVHELDASKPLTLPPKCGPVT